jgi:hypothetical protein
MVENGRAPVGSIGNPRAIHFGRRHVQTWWNYFVPLQCLVGGYARRNRAQMPRDVHQQEHDRAVAGSFERAMTWLCITPPQDESLAVTRNNEKCVRFSGEPMRKNKEIERRTDSRRRSVALVRGSGASFLAMCLGQIGQALEMEIDLGRVWRHDRGAAAFSAEAAVDPGAGEA